MASQKKIYTIVGVSLIIIVLSSCSFSNISKERSEPSAVKSVNQSPIASPTHLVLSPTVVRITPSMTPRSSPTMIPSTSTATNTPEPPIPTSGPTIAPELRQNFLIDLYKTNGGCQLPCWWGFIPGVTRWPEIQAFYQRFDSLFLLNDVAYSKKHISVYSTKHIFGESGVKLYEYYAVKNDYIESIILGGNTVRNNKPYVGDPYYNEILSNYQLPTILSQYGIPDKVWIRTFPGAPEGGDIPFYLILEYTQLGISAKYIGNVMNLGSKFEMCPQKVDLRLLLWSPNKSDESIVKQARNLNFVTDSDFDGYKPLESIIQMSYQLFYDTFKTPGNQNCLSTNPEDWDFR